MSIKARLTWFFLITALILFGASPKQPPLTQQVSDLQHQVAVLQFQEIQDQQNIAALNAWIAYLNGQVTGNGPERMQERDKSQDKF